MRITGLGRSTIYRLIADQKFPSPVRLGPRAVAWRRTDLDQWSEHDPLCIDHGFCCHASGHAVVRRPARRQAGSISFRTTPISNNATRTQRQVVNR
jgi:hypothetical protein